MRWVNRCRSFQLTIINLAVAQYLCIRCTLCTILIIIIIIIIIIIYHSLVQKALGSKYLYIAFSKDCFTSASTSTNVTCLKIWLRRSPDWMAFCRSRIWSSLPAVTGARSALPSAPLPSSPALGRRDHFRPALYKDADERCNQLSSARRRSARPHQLRRLHGRRDDDWFLITLWTPSRTAVGSADLFLYRMFQKKTAKRFITHDKFGTVCRKMNFLQEREVY